MGQIDDAHETEDECQTDRNDKESGCIGDPVKKNEEIVGQQNILALCYQIVIRADFRSLGLDD